MKIHWGLSLFVTLAIGYLIGIKFPAIGSSLLGKIGL